MPNKDVEYNLLLGILAFQMDFIDREAFAQAIASWAADKSKSVDQILRKNRSIDAGTLSILDKLTRKRLDASKSDQHHIFFSPAFIDLVRKELGPFREAEFEPVLSRLRNDPLADTAPYPNREVEGWQVSSMPSDSVFETTRYRLVRLHARGGIGEVFVARDEQLHREVALKQLKDRYADHSESRLRFLLEAKVTGFLEHPGIVPVYGLGSDPDGRPFYAMRLVDGSSLRETIEAFHKPSGDKVAPGRRSIEFRKLLARFQSVCYTVAFAHSRGVLHRDIKPSNIMLGRFGETLVVDWGLAKTFAGRNGSDRPIKPWEDEEIVETLVGVPIGTPAYMSPEQAEGQIERLGPASDVYSLGATLYHLLTGRAPFEGDDPSKILGRVRRGQFPPPQKLKREIPAPLGMICLKSMSLAPEARYPTAEVLADDIDHWLAGEPVSVYRDWLPRRVWRWGRVHPWVVASVGIMIFLRHPLLPALGLRARDPGGTPGHRRGAGRIARGGLPGQSHPRGATRVRPGLPDRDRGGPDPVPARDRLRGVRPSPRECQAPEFARPGRQRPRRLPAGGLPLDDRRQGGREVVVRMGRARDASCSG